MDTPAKVKLKVDAAGVGTIEINGLDLSSSVSAVEVAVGHGKCSQVKLTLTGEVDAELDAYLLKDEQPAPLKLLGERRSQAR